MKKTSINRRKFLFGSVIGPLSFVIWRSLPVSSDKIIKSDILRQGYLETLKHLYVTITQDTSNLTESLTFMEHFIKRNVRDMSLIELKIGLIIVEQSPLFLKGFFNKFSDLDSDQQTLVLESMSHSKILYPVFRGFKELIYMTYYQNPLHWEKIGYGGPVVQLGDLPHLNIPYDELEFKT